MSTEASLQDDPLNEAEFVSHLTTAQTSIYAAILVLLPDRAMASDVLQMTNVTLWEKRKEFVRGSSFVAWARRIARYHVLNERRKLGRERTVFGDALFNELVERQATRDQVAMELPSEVVALRQCLDQLEPAQRGVIEQRYAPGGSVQKIAQERGKSEAAVSQLLYRLREILRNCIELRLSSEASA
jgi:RNA polymerase sigma-70 factor (ECF subfamily)